MSSSFVQLVAVCLLAASTFLPNVIGAMTKLTSVDCQLLGNSKDFAAFEYCRLKAIRRDYSELSVKVNFLKLPINNITGTIQLLKRANGFKPFLYNINLDVCKLVRNANYPMSFEKYVYNIFRKYSNIYNSSCPWTQSFLTTDRFALTNDMLKLPFPSGTYRLDIKLAMDGVFRTYVQLHFVLKE